MNRNFCNDIYTKIISSILNGNSKFLIWGFSEELFGVLSMLKENNLENIIVGVVDDKGFANKSIIAGINVISHKEISSIDFEVLVIATDSKKEEVLRRFVTIDKRLPQVIISGTEHMKFNDQKFNSLKASCLVKSYATGYENTLIHMFQTIKYLYDAGIKGDVAEFGIFKGGTISFTRKMLDFVGFKRDEVNLFGFDCFSGFPEKCSVLDMYSNPKCEFRDYEAVHSFCKTSDIRVVEGNICETYKVLSESKLMLTFFDTDNYTPVKESLEYCFDRTISGGAIIFDHYTTKNEFVETIGERMAAKEILESKKVFHLHDTGVFIKI